MPDLKHLDTTYVDSYLTDTILEPRADHPPIRATRVVVELEHVPDAHGQRAAKVHVTLTGEKIVRAADGTFTTMNTGEVRVFGLAEEQTRYDLCRQAILESLVRHDLEVSDLSSFAFQDEWDTHRSTLGVGAVNLSGAVSRHLHNPDGEDEEDDRW